jgi:hypothetical protein
MNWLKPIDIYCERLDASFWAEPINVLSNIAFLIAAILAWRLYQKTRSKKTPKEVPFLIAMLGIIGVGSFFFHSFANTWSLLADVLPILFFQILALWIFLKRFLNYSSAICAALILLFVVLSQGLSTYVPQAFLNGSAGYLPSLAGQWLIAYGLRHTHKKASQKMWQAGGIFIASLTFRSMDMAMCESVAIGTHFMWHVLNALMLYTVISATLRPKNTSRARA